MKVRKVCFLAVLFALVLFVFAFGFYRLPKISQAVELQGNRESYKMDAMMVAEKGNVYLASGEKVLSQDTPVAEGTLDAALGNLFGCGDPLTNAGKISDTLMGSCFTYTSGSLRQDKSGSFSGYDVYLTIDGKMQTSIYNILSGTRGQAVLINYKTGEILALVSQGKGMKLSECFDMSAYELDENGKVKYNEKTANSVTGTRIYPGSTLKPIVAAALFEEGEGEMLESFRYSCTSAREYIAEGYSLECYMGSAHGEIGLEEALTDSCNKFLPYYVYTQGVNPESLVKRLSSFGIDGVNEQADINQVKSTLCCNMENSFNYMFIGQGDTKMTLLSLATPYMALANGGTVAEPHYIAAYGEIGDAEHKVALATQEHSMMQQETVQTITKSLKKTVSKGTASGIGSEVDVFFKLSAKTGTADYTQEGTHKLCITYSGNEDYPYVLAVDIPESEGRAVDVTGEIWNSLR